MLQPMESFCDESTERQTDGKMEKVIQLSPFLLKGDTKKNQFPGKKTYIVLLWFQITQILLQYIVHTIVYYFYSS